MHVLIVSLLLQLTCPCAPVVAPPVPTPEITYCAAHRWCSTMSLAEANERLVFLAGFINDTTEGKTHPILGDFISASSELQALADAINAEAVEGAKYGN
jgi:hypothetical protein